MADLALIARTVRAAESAQRRAASWGFKVSDLTAQATHAAQGLTLARAAGRDAEAERWAAALARIGAALDKATKARRAAHAAWTRAQATLAAHPLPGDRTP